MLNCEPDNLRIEIEAAIKLRQRHTDVMDSLVQRFVGSSYRSDWGPDEPSIENHEFEYIVNTLPAVVNSNPVVTIKSRRPVVQRELVQAMQHGMNRWIKDVSLKDVLEPIIEDAVFKFGVAVITMEPVPGYHDREAPPMRPAVRRVSPKRFFMDPQADGPDQARFMGHVFVRDRDDMISAKNPNGSPKYDKKAIESLAGPSDGGSGSGSFGFIDDLDVAVDRDQVVAVEVFVPEMGMIYTIGFSTTKDSDRRVGKYLRKPRRYFGHPRGPYILFGFYTVPDQVYPLSPLSVTAEAVTEINAHSEQVKRQASVARNLVLVDSQHTALLDAIVNFEDGSVAGIPNFDRNAYAEVAMGGPNPGQMDYIERLRGRLDRRSGLTDIQRGQVSGKATATEAQLAAAASSGRVRYMQQRIRKSVVEVLENAGWLMFESSSVVFPVSKEKAEKMIFSGLGSDEPFRLEGSENDQEDSIFFGGPQDGQDDYTFFDLEIEIDPYSMEQVDEAVLQKRMETAVTTVSGFAPMMMQYPFINWPELLDDYFQALNIQDGRKYINFELLSQMLGQAFKAGAPLGIPGIDGAPGVDLDTFKGPPNMPAGSDAKEIANDGPSGEGGVASELGAILGSDNSAA